MPLPSFLQRFRPGTPGATPQPPVSPIDIEAARVKARRRMIGMAVLVAAGVIGFPLLFETQPRPLSDDVVVRSAGQPQAVAVVRPQAPPQPAPVEGRVLQSQPDVAETPEPVAPAASAASEAVQDAAPVTRVVPVADRVASAPAADQAAEAAEAAALKARQEARQKAEARARDEARAKDDAKAREVAKAKETAKEEAKAKAKEEARARAALKGDAGKAAKGDEGTRYIVQVGAFSDNDTARAARMKVEKLGITTYTQVADTPAGKKIRVRVGPFTSKTEADKALDKLKKAGLGGNLLTL